MNPKFGFCGYPVGPPDADPRKSEEWNPCGNIATPGCAYCHAHANAVVDDLPPQRKSRFDPRFADVALDTGNGETPPLTADDIVDRAERRRRHWQLFGDVCLCNGYVFLILLIFLFDPAHAWMHSHADYFIGAAIGTIAQGIAWGVWRWRKGDRP